MIKAILAVGEDGEIGQNGDMPWGKDLPKDLAYFKKITSDNPVIMGRKTFESLNMPTGLRGRDTWVVTSQRKDTIWQDNDWNEVCFDNLKLIRDIINPYVSHRLKWEVSIAGGASIYEQFWDYVEEVHITRVKHSFPEADTFFEPDLTGFERVGEDVDVSSDKYEAYVGVWRRVK